jgi:phage gp36-like protein
MAYSAQTDITEALDEAELIELTDDEGMGTVDESVVTRAIADADATIDAYCQAKYTVPLTSTPDKIRQISVDIAVYNLYSRRLSVPEHRTARYKEALRFLEKITEGKISLGAAEPAAEATGHEANVDYSTRIFTRSKMTGF